MIGEDVDTDEDEDTVDDEDEESFNSLSSLLSLE